MDSLTTPLEIEILEKAQAKGILTFDPANIDGQITLVSRMKVQILKTPNRFQIKHPHNTKVLELIKKINKIYYC